MLAHSELSLSQWLQHGYTLVSICPLDSCLRHRVACCADGRIACQTDLMM